MLYVEDEKSFEYQMKIFCCQFTEKPWLILFPINYESSIGTGNGVCSSFSLNPSNGEIASVLYLTSIKMKTETLNMQSKVVKGIGSKYENCW